jgi:hypothetical protein
MRTPVRQQQNGYHAGVRYERRATGNSHNFSTGTNESTRIAAEDKTTQQDWETIFVPYVLGIPCHENGPCSRYM